MESGKYLEKRIRRITTDQAPEDKDLDTREGLRNLRFLHLLLLCISEHTEQECISNSLLQIIQAEHYLIRCRIPDLRGFYAFVESCISIHLRERRLDFFTGRKLQNVYSSCTMSTIS